MDGEGGAAVKLYLQRPLLELRIPEPDLIFLTDLPGGLDSNEWIALHSEFRVQLVSGIRSISMTPFVNGDLVKCSDMRSACL